MRHFLIITDSGAQIRARELWFGKLEESANEELCYVDTKGDEAAIPAGIIVCIAPIEGVPARTPRKAIGFEPNSELAS